MEHARQFFLVDPRFAVTALVAIGSVGFCALMAVLFARRSKRVLSLFFSLPCLAFVFLVGSGNATEAFSDYLEAVDCSVADEEPPWMEKDTVTGKDRSAAAREPIDIRILEQALILAEEILLDPASPRAREWADLEVRWIQETFQRIRERLGRADDWIVQRDLSSDSATHPLAAGEDLHVLAETSERSRRKICLYADQIKVCFAQGEPSTATSGLAVRLAFVLIHELCHLPRKCGGFLSSKVPGTSYGKTPHPQHIGLHRWIAELACWFSAQPDAQDRGHADAARASYEAERRLLHKDRGHYGRVLAALRKQGADLMAGPAGPPHWPPGEAPDCP